MTALFVLAAIALWGLAAAQAQPAADVPARYRGDGEVLRLPTNPASTSGWILAAMRQHELDKKYGFKLEVIPIANVPMTVNALQAGTGDIGVFQFLDIMKMRRAGTMVVAVGPLLAWGANFVLVPVKSPLKTIGDLKGKKVGIFLRTDIDWILIQAVAKNVYKLSPDKDIAFHEGAATLLGGLVQTGQLDAATMYNNLTPALLATGDVRVLVWIRDLITQLGLPELPFLYYGIREAYAKEHPQNVRAYLAAYREAVEVLRRDDEIWATRGKELQMAPETIKLLREEMRVDLVTQFKPTVEADFKQVFEFLLKEAGPDALGGFTAVPDNWISRDYQ